MKWVLLRSDERAVAHLSDGVGIHPVIAALLVNRGIEDPATARSFLSGDLSDLSNPSVFHDMERAVRRINDAVAHREPIVVFGDYDADGVTGSALLFLALREMGATVDYYIPDRIAEGYGLNIAALDRIKYSGAGVVITVDCGISALAETAYARSIGLDLIITDHHELLNSRTAVPNRNSTTTPEPSGPGDLDYRFTVPGASAILHPSLLHPDADARTREQVGVLTGVGVAFKLVQALAGSESIDDHLIRYLDLVTLGTVADIGRITGENRILVKHGLGVLSRTASGARPGITALKETAGLSGKEVTAGIVGFNLAPRINASGRMERANAAFRLLTTGSTEEAISLAGTLESANRERQSVEERIVEEARSLCSSVDTESTGALVFASREWHPGVIGIVASRIVDEFFRPTALISLKDGTGKGSARSIPGFDLYEGLTVCSDLLLGFGGHRCAAGFTIAEDRIPEFRERLGAVVRQRMGPEGFVRTLTIDGPVRLGDLTLPLMREMERLAPFGQGNPEPRLGARGITVLSTRPIGKNHVKIKLRQEQGMPFDAIAFNRRDLLSGPLKENSLIAAVFTPRLRSWGGTIGIELEIRDVKVER